MKREVYVFMDTVSQNYGEPFTLANFADLRREFNKICANPAIPDYVIRDTIVLHLGTFYPDTDNPRIEPLPVAICCLRGDAYDVEEIRRQAVNVASAASQLSAE